MRYVLVVLAVLFLALPAFAATATLTWTDTANNEMGFNVERAPAACPATSATWAIIATPGANVETYADATIVSGSSYCYRLNAWNTVDGTPGGTKQYSAYSNTAGLTVPFGIPAVPSQLGVTVSP